MNDIKSKNISSVNKIPLISLMERASIPWGIKDKESRFVYLNQAAVDFCNIPKGFDFEGRLDSELPVPWYELAPELQAHDRKAEQSKEGAEVIETSYFGRNAVLEPWLCSKFPFYNDEGEVSGTIFYAKKFSFISISDFFNHLKPSVVTLTPPVDTFTEKELDIIFYAFQRLSSKEIATKLSLSHRTVENRLQKIYEKTGVTSPTGLLEYCHTTGLNNYIPKKRLREGVEFFW
ncbi:MULTISPECIES: helix-turn-helix transcriptional regulator [Candidatus Williamhamiltonella]|uniref:Helix-turn-helix transcriptional regulator n=1 Tax=Candidatus Williamhamiltonella defendens TaxID=138072 RepID=A0A2D3TCU6_9ENTR|nr:helix-turn-helix transcriptional regulator [Candidatus Hamiltonella defensa]ATW33605.1 helix-turn-helix transcriptional regulator [Candidatus Hamiltonella defensa]